MPIDESAYVCGGARALVQLHEQHLRAFLEVWERAAASGTTLPQTEDPTCASLEALLRHVFGAARGYMVWICEQLDLPEPGIAPVPDDVPSRARSCLDEILTGWEGPLHHLDQRTLDRSTFDSSWGVPYCIDAMLEHAVMHPIRHTLQLERAINAPQPARS